MTAFSAQLSAQLDVINKVERVDEETFARIYALWKGAVLSYARSIVKDPALAEELFHESFLRAYEKRHTFKPGTELKAWLWTIVRNTCFDHLRKSATKLERATPPESIPQHSSSASITDFSDAETMLIERADRTRVEDCISKLPPQQREALMLRVHGDLEYQEIGRTIGLSLSGIKSLIYRAKINLTRCLGEDR